MSELLEQLGRAYPIEFLYHVIDKCLETELNDHNFQNADLLELYSQTAVLVRQLHLYRTGGPVAWEALPGLIAHLIYLTYKLEGGVRRLT